MTFPPLPDIILFLEATLLLNLTPGADVLYIASRSLGLGRRQGIIAVLGISSGLLVHVMLAGFGVGEIFRYSAFAFWGLKLGGAFYLAYLGWKTFFRKTPLFQESPQVSSRRIYSTYLGGVLTTLLNPTVVLFFLTFLPQFIDEARGEIFSQLFVLGGLFIISGTLTDLAYALFFDTIKQFMLKSQKIALGFQRVVGVLFATLACKLLLADR